MIDRPTIKITVEVQNVRYAGHLSQLISHAHSALQRQLELTHGSKSAVRKGADRIPQGVPLVFVQEYVEGDGE